MNDKGSLTGSLFYICLPMRHAETDTLHYESRKRLDGLHCWRRLCRQKVTVRALTPFDRIAPMLNCGNIIHERAERVCRRSRCVSAVLGSVEAIMAFAPSLSSDISSHICRIRCRGYSLLPESRRHPVKSLRPDTS